jgi:hypothetical protein
VFGSIVQKGKLAAVALALATKALNKVDLPTLGSPTIPAVSMAIYKHITVSKYHGDRNISDLCLLTSTAKLG